MVKKLRMRIFQATKLNQLTKLKQLQTLMLRSKYNLLFGIRRVTVINKGKETAGLDGEIVTTPSQRIELYNQLLNVNCATWKAIPVRRIYIPKSNKKLRPLGIPTIKDRVIQSMVKNSLEPEWEAKFEGSSYGFRPGRSTHDALSRIWKTLAKGSKLWIVDADIKGCFDNIDHSYLMDQLTHFPAKETIHRWLKAGYVEFPFSSTNITPTEQGTPQGGVISPLLANIALHGLEAALGIKTRRTAGHVVGKRTLIRYADDFVILCQSKQDALEGMEETKQWLQKRELEFNTNKTRIIHAEERFNFLGCLIGRYKKGEKYVTLIKPSLEGIDRLKSRIKEIWKKDSNKLPRIIIGKINPILRGWGVYYRPYISSVIFRQIDHWIWTQSRRYAMRRHPGKGQYWVNQKYFLFEGNNDPQKEGKNWIFYDKDGNQRLFHLSSIRIRRHIMIGKDATPDDPSKKDYWEKLRESRVIMKFAGSQSKMILAKKQAYICPKCGESLVGLDELHVHHIKQKSKGGKDIYKNLILLHESCHREVHGKSREIKKIKQFLLTQQEILKTRQKKKELLLDEDTI